MLSESVGVSAGRFQSEVQQPAKEMLASIEQKLSVFGKTITRLEGMMTYAQKAMVYKSEYLKKLNEYRVDSVSHDHWVPVYGNIYYEDTYQSLRSEFEQKIEECCGEFASLEVRHRNAAAQLEPFAREFEVLKVDVASTDAEVRKALNDLIGMSGYKGVLGHHYQQLQQLDADYRRVVSELNAVRKNCQQLDVELRKASSQVQQLQGQNRQLEQAMCANRNDLQRQLADQIREVGGVRQQMNDVRIELEQSQRDRQQLHQQLQSWQQQFNGVQQQLAHSQREVMQLRAANKSLSQRVTEAEGAKVTLQSDLARVTAADKRKGDQIAKLEAKVKQLEAECNRFEDLYQEASNKVSGSRIHTESKTSEEIVRVKVENQRLEQDLTVLKKRLAEKNEVRPGPAAGEIVEYKELERQYNLKKQELADRTATVNLLNGDVKFYRENECTLLHRIEALTAELDQLKLKK